MNHTKITKAFIFSLLLTLCCMATVRAVEIPLDGRIGTSAEGGGTASIGYVDIEKIFAEHPMTARVQAEFQAEVEQRKKEISDLERSVADLQRIIVSSTTEVARMRTELETLKTKGLAPATTVQVPLLPGMEVSSSTQQAASAAPQQKQSSADMNALVAAKEQEIKEKEAGIDALNQESAKKKEEIKQQTKQIKEDLVSLEEKKTITVLNDLYRVLERIATEESITIIIDKNDVLYGQPGQDLTQKVRERLQGR